MIGNMNNVMDFGAVGDGVALDTAAIQRAIDAGGTVYFPRGVYRTGTIYLQSNGGLYLDAEAVIVASHDYDDYNEWDFCPQNWKSDAEFTNGKHLIVAVEKENVFIEGHGTIKGEGSHWINEKMTCRGWPDAEEIDFAVNEKNIRPSQMIYICECKNVRVTGVTLLDSPYWHLFFYGCEDVFAHGLTIKGARTRWTNDGIDIDACSGVTVSDCNIDVGDDGITLRAAGKGSYYGFRHKDNVCERVTITGCVIHSHRDNGIRIGVGTGIIRNCTLSCLDIEAPNGAGFEVNSRWSIATDAITKIENMICSSMNIRARRAFNIVSAVGDAPVNTDCYIKNMVFRNLMVTQRETSFICGREDAPVKNTVMEGIMFISDEMTDKNAEALCVKGCTNIKLSGIDEV